MLSGYELTTPVLLTESMNGPRFGREHTLEIIHLSEKYTLFSKTVGINLDEYLHGSSCRRSFGLRVHASRQFQRLWTGIVS